MQSRSRKVKLGLWRCQGTSRRSKTPAARRQAALSNSTSSAPTASLSSCGLLTHPQSLHALLLGHHLIRRTARLDTKCAAPYILDKDRPMATCQSLTIFFCVIFFFTLISLTTIITSTCYVVRPVSEIGSPLYPPFQNPKKIQLHYTPYSCTTWTCLAIG